MFHLDEKLVEWRRMLRRDHACGDERIASLERQLKKEIADLTSSGLSREEAFEVATLRLGVGDSEFHGPAIQEPGWKKPLLWALGGALFVVIVHSLSPGIWIFGIRLVERLEATLSVEILPDRFVQPFAFANSFILALIPLSLLLGPLAKSPRKKAERLRLKLKSMSSGKIFGLVLSLVLAVTVGNLVLESLIDPNPYEGQLVKRFFQLNAITLITALILLTLSLWVRGLGKRRPAFENSTFDLPLQIGAWRTTLRGCGTLSRSDIDELESHLYEAVGTYSKNGLSTREAFHLAVFRLGRTDLLSREYAVVNSAMIWKKRIQWMLTGYLALTVVASALLTTVPSVFLVRDSLAYLAVPAFIAAILAMAFFQFRRSFLTAGARNYFVEAIKTSILAAFLLSALRILQSYISLKMISYDLGIPVPLDGIRIIACLNWAAVQLCFLGAVLWLGRPESSKEAGVPLTE